MSNIKPVKKNLTKPFTLSVIIPYYNEESVLPDFHQRLCDVLTTMQDSIEVVYVDDGSTDKSQQVAEAFSCQNACIKRISLSRNFGKENAMSAGLSHSNGLAVIIIDADLQDPPELIPSMVAKWREGFDIVNMQRTERLGESWFKQKSASLFYKVINAAAHHPMPENVGDFRLLSREVVDHINALPERNRYMKGLFVWPGYRQVTLPFKRDPRFCGETKWNYFKLIGLAIDGITSFSIRPLRIATLLGCLIALGAFIYGVVVIAKTLLFGETVTGYPSLITVQLALGGIQLMTIGLLGEYIGRIFIETKQRPLYLIKSFSQTDMTMARIEPVKEKRA